MLNISEPAKGPALWQLAFRPFFLAGTMFGVFAIAWWGLFLASASAGTVPGGVSGPIQWHGHEMLFGFGIAIVYGFILTAVQTWTGIPSVKGARLILLWGAWLLARLLWLLPGQQLFWLAMGFDLLFQLLGFWWLLRPVVITRQWHNIGLAIIPLLMLLINGLYYWAALTGDYLQQQHCLQAIIWLFALVMGVVGGRVIPFFTARKLGVEQVGKKGWLEIGCHLGLLLLVFNAVLGEALPAVALLPITLLTALLHAIRLISWWHIGVARVPLLWSLYLAYLFIILFVLAWGLAERLGWLPSDVLHLLSIGAISGMILAMTARVSLGHTGRVLASGPMINTAFALIGLAAVARFLPVLLPLWRLELYYLSAIAWVLAFVIFILCYWKILTTKRADGMPG